jgi:WD40 repeat protein
MFTLQLQEEQSDNLISIRKEQFSFITRDIRYKLKEGFPGSGIRYLHYYEKDTTLIISNISNGRVQLLNLSTGGFRSFVNHTATVRKIRMYNGEIVTSGWDGSVRFTNYFTLNQRLVLTDRTMGRCPFFNISTDGRYLFSFSYDSDLIPLGVANSVRKWSLINGKLLKVLAASTEIKGTPRSGSVMIHRGRLYVCGDSGFFRVFDMETGVLIKEIKTDSDFRSMTSLIHHHYLLASDWEGYIHFFNLENNCIEFKKKCHRTDILCVRVHPKNPDIIITSSTDGVIKFWGMPGFALINTILANHNDIWSMVFINDRLVAGNIDGEIGIYDISDVRKIQWKGSLFISDQSFVVQALGSKMFFTNDISTMEVYSEKEKQKIAGKEAEYLLDQGNNLLVMRELFGIKDRLNGHLFGGADFIPLLPESLE